MTESHPSAETVTEAVQFLQAQGYTTDLVLAAGGVRRAGATDVEPKETCEVDYAFRFEGASDPGDEDIVLGVSQPSTGIKGILVSAYGKDTEPEHAEVLLALIRR